MSFASSAEAAEWLMAPGTGWHAFLHQVLSVVQIPDRLRKEITTGRLPAAAVGRVLDETNLTIDELLSQLVPLAAEFAAPHQSGYRVGAVGQGTSGAVYLGANFEFEALPLNQSVHAEQAVVINAATQSETGLMRLAVSAPPCGHCRQFLNELATASELKIILPHTPARRLAEYLPDAFGPHELGNPSRLLGVKPCGLSFIDNADESHIGARQALHWASLSYAPYTNAHASAAIRMTDGKVYAAPYLENAAFNPSLSPIHGAIVRAAFGGYKPKQIQEIIVAQCVDSMIDHRGSAEFVLARIAPEASIRTILLERR